MKHASTTNGSGRSRSQRALISRAAFAVILFAVTAGASTALAQPESRAGNARPLAEFESSYSEILSSIVDEDGLVDYASLRGRLADEFNRVLKTIETYDASVLDTRAGKLAFWMNAYNIQMLKHLIDSGPIMNVIANGRDELFFRTAVITAGMPVTLDEIENVILRGPAGSGPLAPFALASTDPRLHAGVNCAAVSCPRLRRRAFTAENVDEELDAATREFVSSPRHFRIENDVLKASSLVDWYGDDFDRPGGSSGPGIPAGDWLISYMDPERPNADDIRRLLAGRSSDDLRAADDVQFFYDWTPNDRAQHR